MRKQEFMAMSLPYGLKFMFNGHPFTQTTVSLFGANLIDFNDCKPILHPLSDLTKPIEHNGEKFVPMYELFQPPVDIEKCAFTNERKCYRLYSAIGNEVIKYDVNKDYEVNQFWIIQKLIEWKFNLMNESEEFINVNDLEVNPYK